jgi:preprotein translocase subunit SecA
MDYLKEGINLRAMGQKDPLVEWQREGYEMFGAMMKGIAQDFVRYVMHVQVVRQQAPQLQEPRVVNLQTSSPDDAAAGGSGFDAARAQAIAEGDLPAEAAPAMPTAKPTTVVKDAFDKTPRNAPCPCGSGKKFKNCHGAA